MIIHDKQAKYWLEAAVHHLDVRPILEEGSDPFAVIMNAVSQMSDEDVMVLHALFDPLPLKKQLERMKFPSESSKFEADHWHVRIGPRHLTAGV